MKNLYEFSTFLAGKKPGDTVLVIVNRNGQELPFGVWQIVNEYREYSFG